jgi:hypothetical protein
VMLMFKFDVEYIKLLKYQRLLTVIVIYISTLFITQNNYELFIQLFK